jgi:hypothetical protein
VLEEQASDPVTRGPAHSVAPSAEIVAVPVGVPPPGASAATVAVKVTFWPKVLGLTLDVSEADVPSEAIVWFSGLPVLFEDE